jgi:hypothetical protein
MEQEISKKIDKVNRKQKFWLILGIIFFLFSLFLAVLAAALAQPQIREALFGFWCRQDKNSVAVPWQSKLNKTQANSKPPADFSPRLLDGVYVQKGEENWRPWAVMIDNHIDARPPAGLAKANLVIEAEAEGGITRYLAFFASGEKIKKIGPVRSARPYFVDWARELDALYVHVGGSPAALAKMARENILHINEFYQGEYFWRDPKRARPHNVFTSSDNLEKYLRDKNISPTANFFPWPFKDDIKLESRPASGTIAIGYWQAGYEVRWEYNHQNNNYLRYVGGQIFEDDSGEQITAKNIVIQYLPAKIIDEEKRLEMKVVGEGKALVCRDGVCHDGVWRKRNVSARTRFYNQNGQEFYFNRGHTWIEVTRPGLVEVKTK